MMITVRKLMILPLACGLISCHDRADDAALAKKVVETIQPMFVDEGEVLVHAESGENTSLTVSTLREAFAISNITPYDMKLKMVVEREITLNKGPVEDNRFSQFFSSVTAVIL